MADRPATEPRPDWLEEAENGPWKPEGRIEGDDVDGVWLTNEGGDSLWLASDDVAWLMNHALVEAEAAQGAAPRAPGTEWLVDDLTAKITRLGEINDELFRRLQERREGAASPAALPSDYGALIDVETDYFGNGQNDEDYIERPAREYAERVAEAMKEAHR